MDFNLLKLYYSDIINGFTVGDGEFIKHFGIKDEAFLQKKYFAFLDEAIKKSPAGHCLLEKDTLKQLQDKKIWTKENDLKEKRDFLISCETALSKITNQLDKKLQEESITKLKSEILELETERHNLLGLTAEKYANSKTLTYYLVLAFYKDNELRQPKYTERDVFDMYPEELYEIIDKYNRYLEPYTPNTLKTIGYSNYALSHLSLVDNVWEYYGKPLVDLTFFQINLYSNAFNFKNIIKSHGAPPEEISDNPDYIIEWAQSLNKQPAATSAAPNPADLLQGKDSVDFKSILRADPKNSRILI